MSTIDLVLAALRCDPEGEVSVVVYDAQGAATVYDISGTRTRGGYLQIHVVEEEAETGRALEALLPVELRTEKPFVN